MRTGDVVRSKRIVLRVEAAAVRETQNFIVGVAEVLYGRKGNGVVAAIHPAAHDRFAMA